MTPKVIKTEKQYRQALARIDALMEARSGTAEADELELLVTLVDLYEEEVDPISLPDPVSAIRFRMEQAGLKQKDLVDFIGSRSKVSEVLAGKRTLSLNMMRKLHEGLGIPAEVLLGQPNASLPREIEDIDWQRFPVVEMFRRDWFEGLVGTVAQAKERAEELIRGYLDVLLDDSSVTTAIHRQHVRAGSQLDEYALVAWRARAVWLAKREQIASYEAGAVTPEFMDRLVHLSYLSRGPVLAKEFLAKNGVYLIIERHLPGTHLDGAAMILPDGNPLVALTLRHDRLDNFWFTLCHELGHVALHLADRDTDCYLDDLEAEGDRVEKQADRFARDSLIPSNDWRKARLCEERRVAVVRRFAQQLKVHPAVVAGRIRRESKNYGILSKEVGQGKVRAMFGLV